jgi:hypothetical protein
MQRTSNVPRRRVTAVAFAIAAVLGGSQTAQASDHFDSPAMTANPQADIADIYAWTTADGRRLNLVMTVVGHSFSDRLRYAFHVDSGRAFGRTTETTTIVCRFPAPKIADCRAGETDLAHGDATVEVGLPSRRHRFRVFAGLRDDPFYNNIPGSLAAYGAAAAAVKAGAPMDAAGCPNFDATTVREIKDQWRHTAGGPPMNFLANWTASAIVVSLDLDVVTKGGRILAVWGTTTAPRRRLDRMARPFVGNTLLGTAPFSTDQASGADRQNFNTASPKAAAAYATEIEKSLAFHDGLDGTCGNQLLADAAADPPNRYRTLARVFTDDRLWVNSASRVCTQFFAVELASLAGRKALQGDCGGRSPLYDTPNVWRSLLADATSDSVSDGLHRDEHEPSATAFPFLAAPDTHGIDH